MAGFMGINMGNQTAGGFAAAASQANQQKQETSQTSSSTPAAEWVCSCGNHNTGKFCSECGKAKPEVAFCPNCGNPLTNKSAKFCPECGKPLA
jgi:membrane protease subunit (stomatin/prohibitin family)